MIFRCVVEKIDGEEACLLLGEEAVEVKWPLCYLPQGAEVNDIFRFKVELVLPASEVSKMKPKNLIEVLACTD